MQLESGIIEQAQTLSWSWDNAALYNYNWFSHDLWWVWKGLVVESWIVS